MTARRATVIVLLLAAIAAVALGLPVASWIAGVAAWAKIHPMAAAVLFLAVYVLAAVLLVPGSILTLAAGYLFGLPLGVALTSAGSMLGAAAAFFVIAGPVLLYVAIKAGGGTFGTAVRVFAGPAAIAAFAILPWLALDRFVPGAGRMRDALVLIATPAMATSCP